MSNFRVDLEVHIREIWRSLSKQRHVSIEQIFAANILFFQIEYLLSFIIPLIFLYIDKGNNIFIDESVKILNFNLSIGLYLAVIAIIWFGDFIFGIVYVTPGGSTHNSKLSMRLNSILKRFVDRIFNLCFFGCYALLIFHFCTLVFGITQIARGQIHEYPLSIRLFR
jgi:uncharacterized Tic20 family protein